MPFGFTVVLRYFGEDTSSWMGQRQVGAGDVCYSKESYGHGAIWEMLGKEVVEHALLQKHLTSILLLMLGTCSLPVLLFLSSFGSRQYEIRHTGTERISLCSIHIVLISASFGSHANIL